MSGEAFTDKAEAYAKARPGYAPAALDFISGLVDNPGAAIADIGAGTGKFSVLLAERGFNVIAVEPNGDMRSKLPDCVRAVDGTAEATGLPDASVDAVTCAQAFHWFDGEKFKAECRRILKPGGRIFVLYNNPMEGAGTHDELIWYGYGAKAEECTGGEAAYVKRWREREQCLRDFFGGGMAVNAFPNPVYYDAEGWLAYMLSHSNSPRPGNEIYARFVESVHTIFERRSIEGKLLLPLQTVVYTN